ncbi:hypothetical protein PCC8801_3319 [Rippkaea orientalis PCC 8801]|uniref:Uncharacterized protein n=1 Tax=Rippkaea orientalis (strain PCC 8801 / RF-1) TaxID=41431 RepID=B7JZ79_RIPO1|nr:hypothetical protein [Rippkaea orientalis]ACK67290.1 hypothetical protein PCC8801_3319 [Rippkaea orientalis PCC 8801]
MAPPAIFRLLEKYPQLKAFVEEGRFLTGYTNGGGQGNQVQVFLLRSPWAQFCIQAKAGDLLIPGPVLVITEDLEWSLESKWKAYNLTVNPSSSNHSGRNAKYNQQSRMSGEKSPSRLTTVAAEIATEEAKSFSQPLIQRYSAL